MDPIHTILADDHALVRAGIRNALTSLTQLEIVAEVSNGHALEDVLAAVQPVLLLLDVTMPNFEPITAIRRIRMRYPALKILVVSAYDDDVYVQGLLSAGVDGYYLKDQPLADLPLAVERILAGEQWFSSRLVHKLMNYNSQARQAQVLTSRQIDLLELLQEGLDNQTIAHRTGLSVKTVENHLTRLYRQLDVQSRLEAAHYVRQHPEILGRHAATMLPSAAKPSAPLGQEVVALLVDDNRRYRSQLRRMVGKACPSAVIYEAENTDAALDLTRSVAPQLALVDVVLGEENGIRCTQRIKALLPGMCVILISAYPDREFHRQGLEAGATAFLDKKDLDVASLQSVIEDLIE
ncbi:MAG: response regulator [Caldilineaceae bacterium]|nr:response regulator [Caldilineaceae bacterium]